MDNIKTGNLFTREVMGRICRMTNKKIVTNEDLEQFSFYVV